MTTKKLAITDPDGAEHEIEAPAHWRICSRCDGDGHHSNPSIDGNGITQSEWAEWAPEERDTYMSGGYDVPCDDCGASGKILEIDAAAFERKYPAFYRLWEQSEREDEEYQDMADSEAKWERRMLYGSDY